MKKAIPEDSEKVKKKKAALIAMGLPEYWAEIENA